MVDEECKRLGFGEPALENLNTWIQQQTVTTIPEWIWSNETKSFIHSTRKISEITPIRFGTYGKIYLVYYKGTRTEEYAFMKFKTQKKEQLIQEGILQTIARYILSSYGFIHAVPRVHTFVHHAQWGIGLCIERITGSQILSDYLQSHIQWNTPCITNDTLFLEIFVQLATYLMIFHEHYGIIHGDLKSTNVLLIIPRPKYTKTITLTNGYTWSFSSTLSIILIDFGFAKLNEATTPTAKSRDLFFFLCTLWNIPEFRKSLTPKVVDQIRKWLHDGTTDWAKWLEYSTEDNIHGMYLWTESKRFCNTQCSPFSILKDIQSLYPELISI